MNTLSEDTLELLLKSTSVAIFSDLVLNPIFSAVELELLARLAEMEVPTTTLNCSGFLPWCFQNPRNSKLVCKMCISNRGRGQNLASTRRHVTHELTIVENRKRQLNQLAAEMLSHYQFSVELRNLKYKGLVLGPGIASTLSFTLKTANAELVTCMDLANRLLAASLMIVEVLPEALKTVGAESLVVGNGRLATNWTATQVAEAMGITVFSYENLPTQSFYLAPISPTGAMSNVENSLQYFSKFASEEKYEAEASGFFERQRFPIPHKKEIQALTDKNIFLGLQTRGNLPIEFNLQHRNVAVFLSSEWEFTGLPGWENKLGASQGQIMKSLIENDLLSDEIQFWIRFHPHQAEFVNEVEKVIMLLGQRCHFILPEQDIDSYALLEACEKIITFGSTVGAEATYWGVPSILCGRAEYESLNVTYNPQSLDELVQLVNNYIDPKDRVNTFPYGLLRTMRGINWKYAGLNYPHYPQIHGKSSASLWVKGLTFLKRVLEKLQFETRKIKRTNLQILRKSVMPK